MKLNPVVFREYDIRGVFEQDFDVDFAYQLGRTYVQYLIEKYAQPPFKVSVGHDARLSCPQIKKSLAQGLMDGGADVIFLGLVTSPMTYYSTFDLDVSGAIMITGSHNPPEFNGFKICLGKQTIFGEEIQALRKIMDRGVFAEGQGKETFHSIFPSYLSRYKKEFGTLKSFPFVLDCGNGAAGCIVKELFAQVGLNPEILFLKPDGTFPNHHPDPTVEKNLVALKEAVLKSKAVVGIGFDGDADRIGVIDHTGEMIYGDELMVIFSRAILKTTPGAKIIGDVKCSDRLFQDILERGGQPIMWKTGHSLIKEKIKVEKAPFGGEMSGHIFFADRNYGFDDALYAALRLCEILSQTGKTIPELLEGLPKSYNTPEIRIDTTEEKKQSIVDRLKQKYHLASASYKTNLIDGVRISFKNGWALARASNTQPVLVLRFESDTQEGLNKIESEINEVVNPLL